jgi:hypothetical protein
MTYEIYGRKAYETPLTLLGQVTVEDEGELEGVVLEHFGQADWIEMIAAKQSDVIKVELKW